jgi:hypothetical protein
MLFCVNFFGLKKALISDIYWILTGKDLEFQRFENGKTA